MQAITDHRKIHKLVEEAKISGKTVGFVPTMGALHEGHSSLITYALKECALVVVSIFVNPTQFNNASDLEKYPRNLDGDIEFLKNFKENIIIYAPTSAGVYGSNVSSKKYDFGILEDVMEGAHRPNHFDGVGTVLDKLFRQVNPDKAYFGEKDFQQLMIVKKLVEKENLEIDIIGCPIHRQKNGLAMSSRNARLSREQLEAAPFIYATLLEVRNRFPKASATALRDFVKKAFASKKGLELEYFEIADEENLQPLSRKQKNKKYRAFLAVYAGEIRLIDNVALN